MNVGIIVALLATLFVRLVHLPAQGTPAALDRVSGLVEDDVPAGRHRCDFGGCFPGLRASLLAQGSDAGENLPPAESAISGEALPVAPLADNRRGSCRRSSARDSW